MDESRQHGNRNGIDEAYFDRICEKLPFLRKLREDQEPMGNNYFVLLIHFFKKFSQLDRDLRLNENPQLRYELLFNIIEMGNLIDAMHLIERCEGLEKISADRHERDDIQICTGILRTLKRYRNVLADGYHVYSSKVSAEIIPQFQDFFINLADARPTQRFSQTRATFKESMFDTKEEFRHVNTPEEIFNFISSNGDAEAEKLNIRTLLEGIKYFLDKAAILYQDGKKDCASLYFIASANCARDLENYFLVKTIQKEGRNDLDPNANIELHAARREDQHIKNLLISLRKLRQDRGQQFAHKVGAQKEITAMAMIRRISAENEAKAYMSKIYGAIDTYLFREYKIRSTMAKHSGSIKVTDDSPRGYKVVATHHRERTSPPRQRALFFASPQKPKRDREGKSEKERDVRPGISPKRSRNGGDD